MPGKPIEIGADGIDVDAIVEKIRARVEERRNSGFYDEASVARAERYNLSNLADDEQFLERYLACLRQAVIVDINDFEIVERRARFSSFLKKLKKGIWSLLRFYTYRLWSQQNQVNGMLLAAFEIADQRSRARIRSLEERVAALEARLGAAAAAPADAAPAAGPKEAGK